MKCIILAIIVVLAGCTSPAHLKRNESSRVIEVARTIAAESNALKPDEKARIDEANPEFSYYYVSKPIAQYSIRWSLGPTRDFVISGTGNIHTLEGHTTSIVQK